MAIPDEMQALILTEEGYATAEPTGPYVDDLGTYLTLTRQPVPQPGPGQVLVRVRLSAVNPSDIHFIKGEYGLPRVKGMAAGFEACGDVVATGDGADALAGRRVAFIGSKTGTGAWAEYALAEAASCVPVPDGIRDEDAAAFFVNPLTAVGMISLVAEAGSPAVVLTAGASQLSKLMIGLAADQGIATIPLVRRANQVEALKGLGATHPLDITAPDFADRFGEVSRAEKPRVLLDAVVDDVSAQIFFGMPNRTRWVIYGLLDQAPTVLDQVGQFVFTGKRIEGFWLTSWMASAPKEVVKAAFGEVMTRFASGAWATDIQAKVALGEAHQRLGPELMRENIGKVFIHP